MKQLLTPLIFMFVLAACGSTSEVGTGSGDLPDDATTVTNDGESTIDAPEEPSDLPVRSPGFEEDHVITNDVIVDPKILTPRELVLNPENDTELFVRFTGGDPNCTAALATIITETPERVQVELLVGITEDALARSCMAGEFNLRVDVALNESAAGKELVAVQGSAGDEPALVTPDLTTADFLGLTEDEAAAIVEENLLTARTVRIDDESFMVTEDFNPGRLNFEFDDGVITRVGLG